MTNASFVPDPLIKIIKGNLEFRFFIAWFDCWVGFYIDPKTYSLYICPFPCCVFYFGRIKEIKETEIEL